ncbi:hypothetical protein BDB01DRAFT_853586 [Pilobolus umbonatus]|nr:hypothetical protein BDB01DRAFT_853586 [Pilobolus umbonatus]
MALPGSYPIPTNSMDFFTQLQQQTDDKQVFVIPPPPPMMIPPMTFDRDISPPRKRTRTTSEQLAVLEKSFSINPAPNNRVREQLSHQLSMPERSIQIWFQNRRAKVKNQAKRSVQMQDTNVLLKQQFAASAAAAACQTVALQQHSSSINPNLYYYYYYYYFHQQHQPETSTNIPPPPPPPLSSPWLQQSTTQPTHIPDLSLSTSTSSSSVMSDNRRMRSVSHSSERVRAHSVGPYPHYHRKTTQERHSSLGPPSTRANYQYTNRLYTPSTILEESLLPADDTGKEVYPLTAQTLQIGSWKRVCDLDCQFDITSRTLVWCIGDDQNQQNFRIDIPINLIQYIRVATDKYYPCRLEFYLSSPSQVKFYMTTSPDKWTQCHDFTQDKQASSQSLHIIEGMELLQTQWLDILMQAPEIQSLVLQEQETTDPMSNNLLLLQGLHLP